MAKMAVRVQFKSVLPAVSARRRGDKEPVRWTTRKAKATVGIAISRQSISKINVMRVSPR